MPHPHTGRKCSLKASTPTTEAQRSQSAMKILPHTMTPIPSLPMWMYNASGWISASCMARCFMSTSLQIPTLQSLVVWKWFTIKHCYICAHTQIHMYTCHFVGIWEVMSQSSSTGPWLFLFKTSCGMLLMCHRGVLKQRGISLNKGPLTAQLRRKNVQCCSEELGITVTVMYNLWMVLIDLWMSVGRCFLSRGSRCS